MGGILLRLPVSLNETDARLVKRFAELMRDRYGARIYLFGSRARGTASEDSDYDIIAVSESFASVPWFRRCPDWSQLWHEAGGWRKALDLHCYSPDEFKRELAGLGYIASARSRGELILVRVGRRRAARASEPRPA